MPLRDGEKPAWIWYVEGVPPARILIVDDEVDIVGLLTELLGEAGYEVLSAPDGRAAIRTLYQAQPDLVLLDVAMPGLDGWQTLERIRDMSDVPVLMLTARAREEDKVRGLQAGANDYVTKPFSTRELLARVDAHLRARPSSKAVTETYADDFLTVDFADRSVAVDGNAVTLTPLEFRLLSAFVRNPNRALSTDELLGLAWEDPHGVKRGSVKLYVGYLRRKLSDAGGADVPIETVRGFGYRYRAPRRTAAV
jgi:DNA-binding response OmpR family regulator